uniref:Uncharacterized protein n=1 Tax=Rhizophora mucronata TaxID=61149 RepID=A0A2P2IUT9_RHIMU
MTEGTKMQLSNLSRI